MWSPRSTNTIAPPSTNKNAPLRPCWLAQVLCFVVKGQLRKLEARAAGRGGGGSGAYYPQYASGQYDFEAEDSSSGNYVSCLPCATSAPLAIRASAHAGARLRGGAGV